MAAFYSCVRPRVLGFIQLSYPPVSLTISETHIQLLSKTSVFSGSSGAESQVLTRNVGGAGLQFSPEPQILFPNMRVISSLLFFCHL